MKNFSKIFVIIFVTALLFSCGESSKKISSVKLIPVKSGDVFQYVDQAGKIVINPQFKSASVFNDGLALVQSSGNDVLWGYISEDGKYAINAQFKGATIFSEGLAWVVSENSAPATIDKTGVIQFSMNDADEVRLFSEGLAAFSIIDNEGQIKWGFVDKTGQIKINPQFSRVGDFNGGRCAVRNFDKKWGYIDKEGIIIINYQFDDAESFHNNKAVVESGNKIGLIDQDGKYLINPQFSDMKIDGNKFLIEQGGKYGWCDVDGKILINPQFDEAYPFSGNSITSVKSGDSFGYIDSDGKIVINPQFDAALPFNGKLALVVSADKVGFIDKDGKYVINPQFDDVSRDLVYYMLNGSSIYESVVTDYFNVNAIVSVIDFENPENLTFDISFAEIMQKFNLKESTFNKYGDEHLILRNKLISKEASYNFYVFGTAYDVTANYGWYTTYNYNFNGSHKLYGFKYVISLAARRYGKEDVIISALENKLSGYKRIESTNMYTGDKSIIIISKGRGEITISITELSEGDV